MQQLAHVVQETGIESQGSFRPRFENVPKHSFRVGVGPGVFDRPGGEFDAQRLVLRPSQGLPEIFFFLDPLQRRFRFVPGFQAMFLLIEGPQFQDQGAE